MIFRSKYKEHRLVITPQRQDKTNMGIVIVPGKAVEFVNNRFETEDKEIIEFLLGHQAFGVEIFEEKTEEQQEDELLKKAEEIKDKRKGSGKLEKPATKNAKKSSVADAVEKAAQANK